MNGTANIWVGEVKSSANLYGKAKEQLLLRLSLLEWAVETVYHVLPHRSSKLSIVTKTGKVFMPSEEARGLRSERRRDVLLMVVGV